MTRLLTVPRYYGPLLTLLSIALNQFLITEGVFPVQVAWLYLPVALASFTGLRSGLSSGAIVALYSIWLNPTDPQRVIVVPLSIMALAFLIGEQTRNLRTALRAALDSEARMVAAMARAERNEAAAKAMDALNGNILRIRQARNILLKTLENHPLDETTREEVHVALHTLNNLELATAGWQALDKLKADIEAGRKAPAGEDSDD